MNFTNLVRQHWAALRALLVLTVITGFVYPWSSGESRCFPDCTPRRRAR